MTSLEEDFETYLVHTTDYRPSVLKVNHMWVKGRETRTLTVLKESNARAVRRRDNGVKLGTHASGQFAHPGGTISPILI